MREEYTMTTDDNGDDRACPFQLASESTACRCIGHKCMAWVVQLDDSGKPTGSGRCGMVGVILQMPVTTCASWDGDETKDDPLRLRAKNKKLRAQVKSLRKEVEEADNRVMFWFYLFALTFGRNGNAEGKNQGFKIPDLPQMSTTEIWK